MPQGSSAAPGWFVKVTNEAIQSLAKVAAYLDDVVVFDPDPGAHVLNFKELFKKLRKHNLKLSPSKAKIGATDADFLGHTISPAGIRPSASKVAALTKVPMPLDLKQLRPLLGGLYYYMTKRVRPITSLLKQGVEFVFTPAMEAIARTLVKDYRRRRFWSTQTGTRSLASPALSSSTATMVSMVLEPQLGRNRRVALYALPIVFISRATVESERHWTPLDLEAGSIVWSIKRLQGYLWGTTFRMFSDHKALESFAKVAEHNPRVQRWLEFLTAYRDTLEYRKGSAE